MQEVVNKKREKEKEEYKRAREAWDRRRKELESDIARLREELSQRLEKIEELEKKQKVMYEARANDWHNHLIRTNLPATTSLLSSCTSALSLRLKVSVPPC